MAALALCALSGLALYGAYDPQAGGRSIVRWLLAEPHLAVVRNLHYWAAQLFFVTFAGYLWQLLGASTSPPLPGRAVRLGLILGVPAIAFLAATGFLLRADADARSFQPLVGEITTNLPFVGPLLATRLFGNSDDASAILFHHAVTAPIVVALIFAATLRHPAPRLATFAAVAGATFVVSLFLSPGLNDGLDQRTTGPWLFAGAEIFFAWWRDGLAIVAIVTLFLWALWGLPQLSAAVGRRVRLALLVAAAAYASLCLVGVFWPLRNGTRQLAWPAARGDWRASCALARSAAVPPGAPQLPVVVGRHEGCLVCHSNLSGLTGAHQSTVIGCASCHGGNTTTLDAARAHASMVRIPGNLADALRTCGAAGCHADIIPRVDRSIMTTFAGVIDTNRRVFGETTGPAALLPHVRDLGSSAADSHLRQLCATCHLGHPKTEWGPIVQESRGGGCNACHLVYGEEARQTLDRYKATPLGARTAIPAVHPSLTVNPDNGHCFGCHSRSGRISTSYEGWHELRDPPPPAALRDPAQAPRFRQLDDGRYFERISPDVHHARGLDCIDCHPSAEVMGDGRVVRHKSDQVRLRCEDCHARPLASRPLATAEPESQKLLGLRQWTVPPAARLGSTRAGGTLGNVFVAPDGSAELRRKRTGQPATLRPPLPVCREGAGHARLSCGSCHTPWAPRCASCHTSFNPAAEGFDHLRQQPTAGAWMESSGPFDAAPPTLGIRLDPTEPARRQGVVDTFVPGMILELDRNRSRGGPPDPVFRRLYARLAAHTTSREARSCQSCHYDPVALGYGRGVLRFDVTGGEGRWHFTPAHGPSPQDGLPADAWIGFLQTRPGPVSTRDEVRPFDVEEQRRILRVGACLTCHAGDSAIMRESVRDFPALLARRSSRCVVPVWP